MKRISVLVTAVTMILGFSTLATGALIDNMCNGEPGILIYDTSLNITWYDPVVFIPAAGIMGWSAATAWAAGLAVGGTAAGSWTLPSTLPVNGSTYNYSYNTNGSTDYGYNISALGSAYIGSTASEMAYLYYVELGNKGAFDVNGNAQAGAGLGNRGPFAYLGSSSLYYWSGTESASYPGSAWAFGFGGGYQFWYPESGGFAAMAVHPGDVLGNGVVLPNGPPVPILGDIFLLAPGLVGLAAVRRRLKR